MVGAAWREKWKIRSLMRRSKGDKEGTPCGPVVRTQPFTVEGAGLIPGGEQNIIKSFCNDKCKSLNLSSNKVCRFSKVRE